MPLREGAGNGAVVSGVAVTLPCGKCLVTPEHDSGERLVRCRHGDWAVTAIRQPIKYEVKPVTVPDKLKGE